MENISRLEVHYHLRDESHSMDALIRNRCEAEFLAAVGYIAQTLGANIRFEATVPTEGGFRDIWRVLLDKENRAITATATTAILSLLVNSSIAIWNAPAKPNKELERQQLQINQETIDHWKLENERSALEVKKLRREMNALPAPAAPASGVGQTATVPPGPPSLHVPLAPMARGGTSPNDGGTTRRFALQMDPKVNKRRSNFYKQLITYNEVTAVGFRWLPSDRLSSDELVVSRQDFSSFLMQSDALEPEVNEAVIEIVSPVITEGDMQWKGRWNGQTISFTMDDRLFKSAVFHRQVSFQHGDSIRCVLETERKLDEGGNPKVKGHRVITVLDKIESSGKAYETPQGRRKRFDNNYAEGQPDLFAGEDV